MVPHVEVPIPAFPTPDPAAEMEALRAQTQWPHQQRLEQEGYGEQLLNLRVEFAQANSASLDIVVITDFSVELGDLCNRLRRAIQRWCVDACTENGWEIPFPQMTVSGAIGKLT